MIFATTKERLLQYLDFKGISISKFLQETGIKRGFLDTDKLKSSVSDIFLTMIIAKYEDLNLIWLISGKGDMILSTSSQTSDTITGSDENSNSILQELIDTQKALIDMQKDKIASLENKLKDDKRGKEKAS